MYTGDTGLRGSVGEAGIPGKRGAKGDQGTRWHFMFFGNFKYFLKDQLAQKEIRVILAQEDLKG